MAKKASPPPPPPRPSPVRQERSAGSDKSLPRPTPKSK
jgi:hypothetical protein